MGSKFNQLNYYIMKKQMDAVKEWALFCYNYPYGFIAHCWDDNPGLAEHFGRKFDRLYLSYGSHGVMLAFCAELSHSNYERLIEYVLSGKWRECGK